MRRLYGTELSAHTHRVRLLLSALKLEFDFIDTPLTTRREEWFLALNPFGQVPVLIDSSVTLQDSHAQLVYLATKYDAERRWLPDDPLLAGRVQRWLSVAAGEVAYGPALARNIRRFGGEYNYQQAMRVSRKLLMNLDHHLSNRAWLADENDAASCPSIADLAVHGYVLLAPEGGVSLGEYRHVLAWLARLREQPFYIEIPQAGARANST